MMLDPVKILSKPIRIRSIIFCVFFATYIAFSMFLLFEWVAPSLDGRVDQHIAADSSTYMHFADVLREGRPDPEVIAALYTFPNTLWTPVLLAWALKGTFAIAVADYAMFFLALFLLKRSFTFSTGMFLSLLLLNATTTISLLSVNKEIIDLLVISMFLFARRKGNTPLLLFAILLAVLNRFEVSLVLVLFMVVESKMNPLRHRRIATTVAVLIALSVLLPLAASHTLAMKFEEASGSNTIAFLDTLEVHYMYGLAVFPKIAENLFAELLNVSKWMTSYSLSDLANSYIVFSNNLATLIVLIVLLRERALTLRSDLIYFALMGCVVMAISLVVQPRYFYFVYVLLCLRAAIPKSSLNPEGARLRSPSEELLHA